MSGSTIFLGFAQGNQVVLERWGKTSNALVGESAVIALKKCCYEDLPREPPPPRHSGVYFDPEDNDVHVRLNVADSKRLLGLVESKAEWLGLESELALAIAELEAYNKQPEEAKAPAP